MSTRYPRGSTDLDLQSDDRVQEALSLCNPSKRGLQASSSHSGSRSRAPSRGPNLHYPITIVVTHEGPEACPGAS
jgi:hypothetical protein